MGKFERLAYERHERDLELARQPGGHPKGFWFDEDAGERIVQFIEGFCRHHKGEWAGQPLLLEPWEQFPLRVTFGWKRRDGTRRFRIAYLEVPRKNGKSEIGGAVGNYLTVADQEAGGEVYSTATKEDQAKIVWTAAREMVRQSPSLKKFIRIRQKQLSCERLTSFFRPLGADSKTLDGLNPHGHICDEVHAHKGRELWDVMITAMGARRQPLTFAITTAGVYDPESIGWELHEHAQKVLEGIVEDDTFFGLIFAADEGDDWREPETWAKANPNLGVSVKPSYLEEQCQRAQQSPSFENTFKRLHLNIWTQQVHRWIQIEKWNACDDTPRPWHKATATLEELAELKGRIAFAGLDLSTKLDITAGVVAIPDGEYFDLLCRFWVPEQLVADRAKAGKSPDYAGWVRDGWLSTTPGDVIDYDFIRKELQTLGGILSIQEIGFDPWNAQQLANNLTADAFTMVEMRQGVGTLSEPSKEFEKLIVSQKIRHGGHPVLRWMVSNVAIRRDPNDNIAPDKRSAAGKIDGVVAGIMAIGRAILSLTDGPSVYESRGVIAF